LTHAAILDFDLHHGDGSQDIAWEQNQKAAAAPRSAANHKKTAIGYFSLHDINSYPCEMAEPEKVRNASVCIDKAHNQSIWNVHLEPWKTETEFWGLYDSKYAVLIEKARAFLRLHTERLASTPNGPPAKAAIFISAGFDASEWEGAGMQRHKVNVPTEFYAKFTADVARLATEDGLGVDGRIISVLEGGYSNRALTTGVLSHLSGLVDVTSCVASGFNDDKVDHLTAELTERLGQLDISSVNAKRLSGLPAYDSGWWSPALLDELDALVYPPPAPTKPREKSAPTYFAPTRASTAKAVTPPRDRKSTGSHTSVEIETPLWPLISWATATHELSKILIPSHRQITSCRPEDLNAEATRLRRERQTAAQSTDTRSAAPEERMQLRTRKPKAASNDTVTADTPKRQALSTNRRTTIERASDLPDPSFAKSPSTRSATRRKSAASMVASTSEASATGDGATSSALATSMRRPSNCRSATPKRSSSPKKAPPVPRVPSIFSNLLTGEGTVVTPDAPHSSSAGMETTPQGDVDRLTTGVQRIKLKLPSPEEHAAREKERERQASKTASRAPKVPKEPSGKKVSSPPTNKSTPGPSSALTSSKTGTPTASSPTPSHMVTEGSGAAKMSIGSSWNSESETSTVASARAHPPQMAFSPPVSPGAGHDAVRPQQTLYSPPISEPSVKGLPIFTSNSPIPFASSSAAHGDAPPEETKEHPV
jgi:histone deacetylase HOS3